jgi:hypothetical protein
MKSRKQLNHNQLVSEVRPLSLACCWSSLILLDMSCTSSSFRLQYRTCTGTVLVKNKNIEGPRRSPDLVENCSGGSGTGEIFSDPD